MAIPQNPNAKGTVEHHCTSSIGVVLFLNHEASLEDIIKWADMAMYKAKEDGRILIWFYEGGHNALSGVMVTLGGRHTVMVGCCRSRMALFEQ